MSEVVPNYTAVKQEALKAGDLIFIRVDQQMVPHLVIAASGMLGVLRLSAEFPMFDAKEAAGLILRLNSPWHFVLAPNIPAKCDYGLKDLPIGSIAICAEGRLLVGSTTRWEKALINLDTFQVAKTSMGEFANFNWVIECAFDDRKEWLRIYDPSLNKSA